MNDGDFSKLVQNALILIPKEFLDKMENVTVTTQDWPNRHQVYLLQKRGIRGLLLGLYEGVPQTRRGHYGIGGHLPDKITIFKEPILMMSHNPEDITRLVKDTVIHEIAHHFGISDERLEEIGSGNE